MGVIVVVCAEFDLSVPEAKTEVMCLRKKGMPKSTAIFSVETVGQVYNQTNKLVYLGRNVNHNADLSIEVDRYTPNAWCSIPKYTLKLYDPLRLPSSSNPDAKSRGTRDNAVRLCHVEPARVPLGHDHSFLTRCIGWRKNNRGDHPISYLDTLIKTGSGSIEATLRRRRTLFARPPLLPKCLMFGKVVGGAGCVAGKEKEWMGCHLDYLRAFGINAETSGRLQPRTGLRYTGTVVCPNVTGKTNKERIA